ncbi:hypothetical protein [Halomonas sp. KO116]|uniref:hypothetical protein n=2 Tax=Halomonadaceae TaxID=28256 RepID=UPI0004E32597|nr:hypothetical protein [Halomonas sp. KO116]AJY48956.1 hypothetical protein KO116_00448 [Halomonas sp. KO116]
MSTAPPPTDPPEAPRIQLEHKLLVRRILIDRVLIGALLIVAGLIANIVLEKYKADRGQSQFFLDKRLAAATEVRRDLTDVTNSLFKLSEAMCSVSSFDEEEPQRLKNANTKLISAFNSASLLFDESYLAEANRVVNIFAGVSVKLAALTCDAREFLAETARYLTHQTKRQVAPSLHNEWDRFVPLDLPPDEIDEIGVDGYFVKNLEAWRRAEGSASPLSASR